MHHYDNFGQTMENLFYDGSNEKAILNELFNQLFEGQHFNRGLDIGAGPGLITQPLVDHTSQVVLIEPIDSHITILKDKFPNASLYNGVFQNFKTSDSFNIILCAHMLYYLNPAELLPILEKMINLLAPAGKLILINAETDFIFDIFIPKLEHKLKVFRPKTDKIIDALLPHGDLEVLPYTYQKQLANDTEIINYLAGYLIVGREELLTCPHEIETFKQLLTRNKDKYILTHFNSIINFSKHSINN